MTYPELRDQELFDLVKLGDEAAFKEIYERYFDILFIHAYKRFRDREEAQDIVQEIFTTLWSKRQEIFLRGRFPVYLYTAVRNKIFNILSHKKIESSYIQSLQYFIDQGVCQTDHLIRENALSEIIEREVAALPPKMKKVFELSRNKYLTHKEIAIELNLSEQTVKKQINNALRILRTKLGLFSFLLLILY